MHEAIRPSRRPTVSAKKGEDKEPKNVPADKIETIADDCEGDTSGSPLVLMYPVEKSLCQ